MGILQNRICIVTGAGGGIGSEICRTFATEGADAVVALDLHGDLVERWRSTFAGAGRITVMEADITSEQSVKTAIQQVRRQFGRIDVLVNCAGIEFNENIGCIDYGHMTQMFSVNVFGSIEMMQYAARVMMRQRSGSVINIASVVGVYGNPGQTVYAATKGAVISMTKSAAKELAPYGIRVNAIAPGLTNTSMIRQTDPEALKGRVERIALKRMAEPQDIANAAAFLASDKASFVTGHILGVDGGTIM